jgi:nucleoside phosphorylase
VEPLQIEPSSTRDVDLQTVQGQTAKYSKLLIVTATGVETRAVLSRMAPWPLFGSLVRAFDGSRTYVVGLLGRYLAVHLQTLRMGAVQSGASLETTAQAIKDWMPAAVVMPGIAFGRDRTKHLAGDLLVARSIVPYDSAVVRPGKIEPRSDAIPTSPLLFDRFTHQECWKSPETKQITTVHRCTLLSGEKLINDPVFKTRLFKQFPHAAGGEMEAVGVSTACAERGIPWIVVKAVCDWGDGEKDDRFQSVAALNAAHYCEHVFGSPVAFRGLNLEVADTVGPPSSDGFRMMDIAALIHPNFPRQKQSVSDHQQKVHYEYVTVRIGKSFEDGYLYVASNINIRATVEHFVSNTTLPSQLTVCSPRVMGKGKQQENFRLENLREEFTRQLTDIADLTYCDRMEYSFVDDFVWRHCLGDAAAALEGSVGDLRHYVDQELYEILGIDETAQLEDSCERWFQKLLESPADERVHPVSVVLGKGGVGKTTLCKRIASLVNRFPSTRAVFIAAQEIRKVPPTAIVNSVKTLYELYAGQDDTPDLIDPDNFVLNLSCGNLVLIIDGLDEITSSLREQFDLKSFLESVFSLNNRFNSCRIVVTSRDYQRREYLEFSGIKLVHLRGFDKSHMDKYLNKRLSQYDKEVIGRARGYVQDFGLKEDEFYLPFSLALICDIVEREVDATGMMEVGDTTVTPRVPSNYLVPGQTLDEIIGTLLHREIEKQSLRSNVDELFLLLSEIAIKYRGEIAISDFEEEVQLSFASDSLDSKYEQVRAFRANPLLSPCGCDRLRFTYGILGNFICARKFRHDFLEKMDRGCVFETLQDFRQGAGELFRESVSILSNGKDVRPQATFFLKRIIKQYEAARQQTDTRSRRMEMYKCEQAISGLLHLYFACVGASDRLKVTENLLRLYEAKEGCLSHVFVHGAFYPLDFTELTVERSAFRNYTKLFKCRFPRHGRQVFSYCAFEFNQPIYGDERLDPSWFERESCALIGEAAEMFHLDDDSSSGRAERCAKDVAKLLAVFRAGPTFLPRSERVLLQRVSPKSVTAFRARLGELCGEGILERRADQHYQVSNEFQESCGTLVDQKYLDPKLEKCVRRISQRGR